MRAHSITGRSSEDYAHSNTTTSTASVDRALRLLNVADALKQELELTVWPALYCHLPMPAIVCSIACLSQLILAVFAGELLKGCGCVCVSVIIAALGLH